MPLQAVGYVSERSQLFLFHGCDFSVPIYLARQRMLSLTDAKWFSILLCMNKPAIQNITRTLGDDAICAALGVTHHSVRGARTTGVFPASWYDTLQSMCIEAGIPCPRNAFNWKAAAKKSSDTDVAVSGSRSRQAVSGRDCPKGQVDSAATIGGAA